MGVCVLCWACRWNARRWSAVGMQPSSFTTPDPQTHTCYPLPNQPPCSRIVMVGARDRLLPPQLSRISKRTQTPAFAQLLVGGIICEAAGGERLIQLACKWTGRAWGCCLECHSVVTPPILSHPPALPPNRQPNCAAIISLLTSTASLQRFTVICYIVTYFVIANALMVRRYLPGQPRLRCNRCVAAGWA